MELTAVSITPLVSLIAGVLILIMPRLLNYIVAIYLIIIGLVGLFPNIAG
jgi:hypothetical protein